MTVRRRLLAVLASAVLAGPTACADDAEPASGSSSVSLTEEASHDEPALPCVPGVEPFTGEAADEVGADAVMAAYCALVEFTLDHGFTALVVPDAVRRERDYRFVRDHLSPQARRRWDAAVEQYVESRAPQSAAVINGLTLHDVRDVPDGYLIPREGPYSFGTETGPAEVSAAADGSLTLTLELRSGIVLEEKGDDSGRHSLLPVTRVGTYTLVPGDASDEWLIHRWAATLRTGAVRIVTGG